MRFTAFTLIPLQAVLAFAIPLEDGNTAVWTKDTVVPFGTRLQVLQEDMEAAIKSGFIFDNDRRRGNCPEYKCGGVCHARICTCNLC